MFGRIYSNPKIVSLMVEHSVARKKYGKNVRNIFRIVGPPMLFLFGYPLDMEIRRRVKPVERLLIPTPGDTILDVGCGIGYFSFEFIKHGSTTVGLDIDLEDIMLAKGVKKNQEVSPANFIQGSGLTLPFKEGSFDKILASEIIEHIEDDSSFVIELSKTLKPGGVLVLTTPYSSSPVEYSREHFKKIKSANILGGHVRSGYNIKTLEELFSEADLELKYHTFSYKRFTKLGRAIIKCCGWVGAPLAFLVSILDEFSKGGRGKCIIVSARKSG